MSRSSLQEAETKLETVETRISALVGVSRDGVTALRQEISSVRDMVDTDRQDILSSLSDMTRLVDIRYQVLEIW